MRTVRRLLYSEILKSVAFVALAFLALFYFIDLVEELGDVGRRGYRAQDAVIYCLLMMPGHLYDLAPIALLIGATYAMARFARTSEFTILRTGGLGPVRALRLLAILGLTLGALTFVVGDYLVPLSERYASLFHARFSGGVSVSRNGAWLKDTLPAPDGLRNVVVQVSHIDKEGRFANARIYEFDAQGRLVLRLQARSASVDDNGLWLLSQVQRSRWDYPPVTTTPAVPPAAAPDTPASGATAIDPIAATPARVTDDSLPTLQWTSHLGNRVVTAAVLPVKTMSTPGLYTYMNHLSEHAQTGQTYEIQFWKRALYPLSCLVMMALALPFAYLHGRSDGISLRVFGGIMLGISFVLINNVSSHLGLLHEWRPWLAAALPSLVYLLLSMAAFTWLVRYR